uniref:Coiled-coil domain containing 63 n=1 Tax=Lepisosteus oculatus TaxID=7918 RepID=W5MKN4_LEPOC
MEAELSRLRHQHHVLKMESKTYSDQAQHRIHKQHYMKVNRMLKEQDEMETNINLMTSNQRTLSDHCHLLELKCLLEKQDHYNTLIQKQKDHITKLEVQIKEVEAKLLEKKKRMRGRNCTQHRPAQQQKQIRILESRVSQATMQFDKLLSRNQALRVDIDHLRWQRDTFGQLYQKMSKDVLLQHSIMQELVEKSTQAYDQRSEALARMQAVKDRSQKDLVLYNTELKEMMRVIDHEDKLRSFMMLKSQERSAAAEDEPTSGKKKKNAEQALQERTGAESLETYQAVHRRMVELAGEDNLKEIGRKFVENEEKNFAYFNYINELNNEAEMLELKINRIFLQNEILQFQLEDRHHEEQRNASLKELEVKLETTRSQADALESRYKLTCKSLDQLKTGIADLFTKMNCDPLPILEKLGGSEGISYSNVTQYIGILEQKVNEMLMVLSYLNLKDAEEQDLPATNPLLASSALIPTVMPVKTEVPPDFEESEAEQQQAADDGKPLDIRSLREKVLPKVMASEELAKRCELSKADCRTHREKKKLSTVVKTT